MAPTKKKTDQSSGNAALAKSPVAKDLIPVPEDCQPTWHLWSGNPIVELYEAVALSCNIDPEATLSTGEYYTSEVDLYEDRLAVAKRHFPARRYPDGVPLADFVAWAIRMATRSPTWTDLPEEFTKLVREEPASVDATKPAAEDNSVPTRKPKSVHGRKPSAEDGPGNSRQRNNLCRIIVALAKTSGFDIVNDIMNTAGEIEARTTKAGHRVPARTAEYFLNMARDLVEDENNGAEDEDDSEGDENKGE